MTDAPKTIWISTGCYPDYDQMWIEGEWSNDEDQGGGAYVPQAELAALQAENAKRQKEKQELCLQVMASDMQAQEAYEAQLKAEAENAKLREAAESLAAHMRKIGSENRNCSGDSDNLALCVHTTACVAAIALSAYRNVKGENE